MPLAKYRFPTIYAPLKQNDGFRLHKKSAPDRPTQKPAGASAGHTESEPSPKPKVNQGILTAVFACAGSVLVLDAGNKGEVLDFGQVKVHTNG